MILSAHDHINEYQNAGQEFNSPSSLGLKLLERNPIDQESAELETAVCSKLCPLVPQGPLNVDNEPISYFPLGNRLTVPWGKEEPTDIT